MGQPGGEPDPALVNHAMQEAIDALQRANVTLYAVDPRRLYSPESCSRKCRHRNGARDSRESAVP